MKYWFDMRIANTLVLLLNLSPWKLSPSYHATDRVSEPGCKLTTASVSVYCIAARSYKEYFWEFQNGWKRTTASVSVCCIAARSYKDYSWADSTLSGSSSWDMIQQRKTKGELVEAQPPFIMQKGSLKPGWKLTAASVSVYCIAARSSGAQCRGMSTLSGSSSRKVWRPDAAPRWLSYRMAAAP